MSFANTMPPMYHGQIEHECQEFHRYSTHFASQDLSSDFGRCHRNNNGYQQSAIRYPSSNDVHVTHQCNGCEFFRGWDQSTHAGNNPLPLYHPAPFYQVRGSKCGTHLMSASQSPSFIQSSRGSGSSEASFKTFPTKPCLDDSWFRTPEQENEELKVVMKMKNQKINELAVKAEKQNQQICDLKKELLKAESSVKEKGRLVREELKKTKEKYKKLLVKFKKLYNKFTQKNVIWKRKHKKLGNENKYLKEELHQTKNNLRSTKGLLAIQEKKLTGWGSTFNTALKVDRSSDLSEIGIDSEEEDFPPRITPEGEPLENPKGCVLEDLCRLSKEERTVKKVSKTHRYNQLNDLLSKTSIQKNLKSPMDQIFKPEHTLFNPNDFTNTDKAEQLEDELFEGNNGRHSGGEANFWAFPNPPALTNVENNITDLEKISQDDQTCEFPKIFTPGTPNSLSSVVN